MSGVARPRLLPGVRLIEQRYRGEERVLARTPDGGKYFRFRPLEARVLRAFDGVRTAAEISELLAAQGTRIGAGAIAGFARQLAGMGVVERSLEERSAAQLERIRAERRTRRGVGDLLRIRRSLGDPDALLDRTLPALRWCYSRPFVAASLALFATYFAILAARWPEFQAQVAATLLPGSLSLGTAALVWVVIVVISTIHELGHGYTCKRYGGEVHELGVMLLYFMPAFYCNVSDAWSFPERRARLWVTAAGPWVQMIVASLAAIVWCLTDPASAVSRVALVTMFTGGISTVISNANPLLPLDGYYALSDWLELPNLRHRASEYVTWWARCRVLQLELPEPDLTPRERRIVLTYGVLAAVYGAAVLAVTAGILLGVAWRVAGALGVGLVLIPILAVLRSRMRGLWASRQLIARRVRRVLPASWQRRRGSRHGPPRGVALGMTLGAALVAVLALPWPRTVDGTFDAAALRPQRVTAPAAGLVAEVLVREGERVAPGAPLARLVDYGAARALRTAERVVDSLSGAEVAARTRGTADGARLTAERAAAVMRRDGLRDATRRTLVRAGWAGVVLSARPEALLGRRVAAGELLLRLGDGDSLDVRVLLRVGAGLVRPGQRVHLLSDAADGRAATVVAVVVPLDRHRSGDQVVEARVRLDAGRAWRVGTRGAARVEVARSTVAGAVWWAVRTRLRGDLLL